MTAGRPAPEPQAFIDYIMDNPGCHSMDMMQKFNVSHQCVRRKLKGTKDVIRIDTRNMPYRYWPIKKRPPPEPMKPRNVLPAPLARWWPEQAGIDAKVWAR